MSCNSRPKLKSYLCGTAGEFLVAAELSLRGLVVALTTKNAQGHDLMVSDDRGARVISIQVKASQEHTADWILNKKSEIPGGEMHFYVFVHLPTDALDAEYYIVPSAEVAAYLTASHKAYLSEPKRDGSKRKDTSMRRFKDKEAKYLGRWELLGF